ncbi:hypothetical protein [Nostoc sp.]|uniref:hypothetical protein n=1 Tax=Nostoc sp. TaxID=1180 RepID=UPI002FF41DD6
MNYELSISKYTWRLEIVATQTKPACADSKNLKPTEVGFVCIAKPVRSSPLALASPKGRG